MGIFDKLRRKKREDTVILHSYPYYYQQYQNPHQQYATTGYYYQQDTQTYAPYTQQVAPQYAQTAQQPYAPVAPQYPTGTYAPLPPSPDMHLYSMPYYDAVSKACTGIVGLDMQLQGGFRRGEIYLIAGEAGMGKTIFALQFLKTGAERGEVGIYITVDEPSEDVKRGVREALGWDLEKYENDGKLIFLDFRTHFRIYSRETNITIDPRELAKVITDYIRKYDAKRLVIDPIAPLIITSHHDIMWVREYLRELVFQLKKFKDVTTVITSEIPTGEEKKISRFGVEEYLASGVIILSLEEYYGHLMRVMFIRKMRWTPINPVKLVFEIRYNEGIVVLKRLDEYLRELSQQYQYARERTRTVTVR